jgi:hypothetical protein
MSSIPCRYCGNPIVFDDNIISKNGKRKPLNEWNHEVHDCELSPFNKSRATAREKKALKKIKEYQVIENLQNQVAATNNRLWNYELELIVKEKEL